MKFAIVGAGAIGAFLGARLAQAGEEVYLIARGPTIANFMSGNPGKSGRPLPGVPDGIQVSQGNPHR